MRFVVALFVASLVIVNANAREQPRGTRLEDVAWPEAEKLLRAETVVVIPLGAESKEHGPHLRLGNDFLMASYLADRVRTRADVVVAPIINYSFYPSFVEYPGATTLRFTAARDQIVDICRDLSRFGPRRFYVLNTGVSTNRPLKAAAALLRDDGIEMRFTDLLKIMDPITKPLATQPEGTHADEMETSMMLYMAPRSVDMKKAVRDIHPQNGEGGMTRDEKRPGLYSPSGVYGDATLATREKGKKVTEALVTTILSQIEELRHADLPRASPLDASHLTGTYRLPDGHDVVVAEEAGSLKATLPDKKVVILLRDSSKHFYSPAFPVDLRFIEDQGVPAVVIENGADTMVAIRLP
ncbi:MAG TPA: creatininase family protein [Thermoanaerobaculia bacterium]|nr:creatininase family protein [Thermoanaerobaculia bacterium]